MSFQYQPTHSTMLDHWLDRHRHLIIAQPSPYIDQHPVAQNSVPPCWLWQGRRDSQGRGIITREEAHIPNHTSKYQHRIVLLHHHLWRLYYHTEIIQHQNDPKQRHRYIGTLYHKPNICSWLPHCVNPEHYSTRPDEGYNRRVTHLS